MQYLGSRNRRGEVEQMTQVKEQLSIGLARSGCIDLCADLRCSCRSDIMKNEFKKVDQAYIANAEAKNDTVSMCCGSCAVAAYGPLPPASQLASQLRT